MAKTRVNWDFDGFQLLNARIDNRTTDPTLAASDAGRAWFDSTNSQFKGWTGTAVTKLSNIIESVSASGALHAVGPDAAKNVALTIDSASGSGPGVMSATHFTLLSGATPNNVPSMLVQRDATGNITVATVTGALSGTASNASALGGASLTQVRDFSQTTGARDHTAINDFMATVYGARMDQLTAPTAAVPFGSQRATGLADPVNPQDGATKNYVDSVATGLDTKASVRAATDAALTATYANGTSGQGATLTATANGAIGTVGGVTNLALNDRVLVKMQATAAQNGIYRVTQLGDASNPWILTRAVDADTAAELTPGAYTFVEEGTYVGSGWVMNGAGPITIGTTALPWAQFTGGQAYSPGNGLTLAGSTFSVVGTANRIAVSASGVDIASTYVGQTSITTLGTIGTGVWNGTAVGLAYGGTGATTAAAARANIGAPGKYAAAVPAIAAGGTVTITHGLGTTDVGVFVINQSTGEIEYFDVTGITTTQLTLGSQGAIAASAYRIVVLG